MPARNVGIICDSCRKENFELLRYKCLICYDFDLCAVCFAAKVNVETHSSNHPMQCILLSANQKEFFSQANKITYNKECYTCPYCGDLGFTQSSFLLHVSSKHAGDRREVLCPLCFDQSATVANTPHSSLVNHIERSHGCSKPANSTLTAEPQTDLYSPSKSTPALNMLFSGPEPESIVKKTTPKARDIINSIVLKGDRSRPFSANCDFNVHESDAFITSVVELCDDIVEESGTVQKSSVTERPLENADSPAVDTDEDVRQAVEASSRSPSAVTAKRKAPPKPQLMLKEVLGTNSNAYIGSPSSPSFRDGANKNATQVAQSDATQRDEPETVITNETWSNIAQCLIWESFWGIKLNDEKSTTSDFH